jgi:seryl-tRNA synthetase
MLDLRYVRDNLDDVVTQLARRGFEFDASGFQSLDEARKQADIQSQSLQAERKKASKQIGQLVSQGIPVDEAKAQVAEILERLDQQLANEVNKAKAIQEQLNDFLMSVPNLPDASVPSGSDEQDNIEVMRFGEPTAFEFPAKDHVDIGNTLGFDFEVAAKITGSRFAVLRGDLAKLHRALAQFMLDTHTEQHGYEEVAVPFIVHQDALKGTGQLPKFEEDQFKLSEERPFYLIPTAEVPVTNLVRESILEQQSLPLKMTSHTPCFRSEAGSAGRDTRGFIRQHQFEKVELVQVVTADQSEQALEVLTSHAEAILQALKLPYRKMLLCSGDMGFSAVKTYDLEVWLPGQQAYREISSCSNCRDYQARRMQARVRLENVPKPELVHTLNGSGLAVGRTLVAVLENYQQADGSVRVPKVLQAYMKGQQQLVPVKG